MKFVRYFLLYIQILHGYFSIEVGKGSIQLLKLFYLKLWKFLENTLYFIPSKTKQKVCSNASLQIS